VGLASDDEFLRPSLDALIDVARLEGAKAVVVCTPHNPIGFAWGMDSLKELYCATSGLLVVDEAYIEFSDRESFASFAIQSDRAIVLRTLSKAFGLAGLRLGFGIANEEITGALQAAKDLYNNDAFSQAVGTEALKNKDAITSFIASAKMERDALYQELCALPGIKPFPSEGNFFYIESQQAADLYRAALEKGILTRSYADPYHIRVTVGTHEENEKLLESFREVLA